MSNPPYRYPISRDYIDIMENTPAKTKGKTYRVNFGDHIDDMNFMKSYGGYVHPGYADWKWLCENTELGPVLFSEFFSWWKENYKSGYHLLLKGDSMTYVPYRGKIK